MYEKMMELKMKSEELKQIKETLLSWVKKEMSTGDNCAHIESMGQTVDMIKDLAETEKECAEAMYYMIVSEAMLKGEEPTYGESMGYNHRHLNNGRFASSGRGHIVSGTHSGSYGYSRPYIDQEPYIDGYLHDPNFVHKMNMGYDGMDESRNRSSKYGESYDRYRDARRHYTQSRKPEDKAEMDRHAMSHVNNALESLHDMWNSSDDSALKNRIVDEMSEVLKQMKGTV